MLETAKRYHGIPFDRLISVAVANAFKPHVATYTKAAEIVGVRMDEVLFIANHAFDCIGAKSAGMRTAFIDRRQRPFGITPHQPDLIVPTMKGSGGYFGLTSICPASPFGLKRNRTHRREQDRLHWSVDRSRTELLSQSRGHGLSDLFETIRNMRLDMATQHPALASRYCSFPEQNSYGSVPAISRKRGQQTQRQARSA
jgi:hypothetical protein